MRNFIVIIFSLLFILTFAQNNCKCSRETANISSFTIDDKNIHQFKTVTIKDGFYLYDMKIKNDQALIDTLKKLNEKGILKDLDKDTLLMNGLISYGGISQTKIEEKQFIDSLGLLPIKMILKKLCKRHPFFVLSGDPDLVIRKSPLDPVWQFEGNRRDKIGNFKHGNLKVIEKLIRINARTGRMLRTKRIRSEAIYHWE